MENEARWERQDWIAHLSLSCLFGVIYFFSALRDGGIAVITRKPRPTSFFVFARCGNRDWGRAEGQRGVGGYPFDAVPAFFVQQFQNSQGA